MWPSYLSPESSRPGSTPSPSSGPPFQHQQQQQQQPQPTTHLASTQSTTAAALSAEQTARPPSSQQQQQQQQQFTDVPCQMAGSGAGSGNTTTTVSTGSSRLSMAGNVAAGGGTTSTTTPTAAATATNPASIAGAAGGAAAPTEEDELTIPRAAMNKMLKELLPNVRIANESRELVLNCCSEFIHHIATRANEVCNQHHKKTINADHILTALDNLGFSEYCEDAQRVFADCKEVAAKRRKQSSRLEHLGVPEEELLRQQQELFAKARQEQAEQAQQDWANIQQVAVTGLPIAPDSDDDEY